MRPPLRVLPVFLCLLCVVPASATAPSSARSVMQSKAWAVLAADTVSQRLAAPLHRLPPSFAPLNAHRDGQRQRRDPRSSSGISILLPFSMGVVILLSRCICGPGTSHSPRPGHPVTATWVHPWPADAIPFAVFTMTRLYKSWQALSFPRARQLDAQWSDVFTADKYSETSLLLPPAIGSLPGEYTIVLDMDETLLTSRLKKPMFVSSKVKLLELAFEDGPMWSLVRPGAQELVQSLAPRCELVLWTAGVEEYARQAMGHIDPSGCIRHAIYRDDSWFRWPLCKKELQRLGRPMDRVLLVDNSTFVCVNPENTILVADFMGRPYDSVLRRLLPILTGLLDSDLPVPQFLALCAEYGQLALHQGRYWLPDES